MTEPHPGARSITGSVHTAAANSPLVVSCYWHATKGHVATTVARLTTLVGGYREVVPITRRAFAPPKTWACSVQPRSGSRRSKAFYDTCDTIDCSELGADRPPAAL